MASKTIYKNANGINAEVTLINPDTNFNKRTVELNSIMDKTPTIATLRAKTEIPETVYVTGYHSEGDGAFGSHFFKWNPTSTDDDNGGTVIKLDGVETGRYELQYDGAVNVKWFGAKGDGVTDDTAAIQNAIDSGADIKTPDGIYLLSDRIDLTGCKSFIGSGSSNTKFKANGNLSGGTLFTFQPIESDWLEEITYLNTNIDEIGKKQVIVNDSTNLNKGDLCIIWDSLDSSWSGFRPDYRKGEFFTIDNKTSNTLDTVESLFDSYVATTTTKIYKHSGKSFKIGGFEIESQLQTDGTNEFGIVFNGANGLQVYDIKSNSWNYTCLSIGRCFNVTIDNVTINMTELPATSYTNYCVVIGNSQNVRTTNSYLKSIRHAIAHGGGPSNGSIVVRNSVVSNCTLIGTSSVGAVDFHGNVEACSFENNYIDGGCVLGGHRNKFINNTIKNSNGASAINCSELLSLEHQISGNTIQCHFTGFSRGGFFDCGGNTAPLSSDSTRNGYLNISNNNVRCNAFEDENDSALIFIRNRGSLATNNIIISGNTVESLIGNDALFTLRADLISGSEFNNITITGNTLLNCSVDVGAKNIDLIGNIIDGGNQTKLSTHGVFVSASQLVNVSSNTIKNSRLSGLYIVGDSSSTKLSAIGNTIEEFSFTQSSSTHRCGIIIQNLNKAFIDGNNIETTQPDSGFGIRNNGTVNELVVGTNNIVIKGTRILVVSDVGTIGNFIPLNSYPELGTAAPTIIPRFIGQEFIDTNADIIYKSTGTTSSSDWKALN